jgi:hypothetical protein
MIIVVFSGSAVQYGLQLAQPSAPSALRQDTHDANYMALQQHNSRAAEMPAR